MRVYFVRFLLFLKARIKSPFTYMWVILIACSLYLVKESVIPLENPSDVLILNRAGEYGDRIISLLQEGGNISAFRYIEVSDEDVLRNDVKKGSAHVGFILPEDLEERIEAGDTGDMITMVTSVFSVKSAAVRERVFAALFRVMNADVIESAESSVFEDPLLVKDYIRERYEYYSAGKDVFGIEYEYVSCSDKEQGHLLKDSSDPVRGVAAVLIFILCLYSGGALFGRDGSFYKCLGNFEKFISIVLYELSSVIIPGIGSFVIIRILDADGITFFRDLFCFLLFIMVSCIWSAVFILFFRKSESYYPVVSVLLFVSFLFCPVFVDIGQYISVIAYVARILPPAFYLYLL